jgi:hypothetical protein
MIYTLSPAVLLMSKYIYDLCLIYIYNLYPFLYFDFLFKAACQSKIGVPEVVRVPQFEKPWPRLQNYVYNLFIR